MTPWRPLAIVGLALVTACWPEREPFKSSPTASAGPAVVAPAVSEASSAPHAGPISPPLRWLVLGSGGTAIASWDGRDLSVDARSEHSFLVYQGEIWEIVIEHTDSYPVHVCGRTLSERDPLRMGSLPWLLRGGDLFTFPVPPLAPTVSRELILKEDIQFTGFVDGAVFSVRNLSVAHCTDNIHAEPPYETFRSEEEFVDHGPIAMIEDGLGYLTESQRVEFEDSTGDLFRNRAHGIEGPTSPHLAGVVLRAGPDGLQPVLDLHNHPCRLPCGPLGWRQYAVSSWAQLRPPPLRPVASGGSWPLWPPWLSPSSLSPPWWKRSEELKIGAVRGFARLADDVALPPELAHSSP